MKLFRIILVVAIFAALTALTASAQGSNTSRQGAPTAQGGAVVPDGKIAVIDSDQFADPQAGIKKLVNALSIVDREFKPRRDEVEKLTQRFNEMVKNIDATRKIADEKALNAKAEEAQTLKTEIEGKQQAGQRDLEKRIKELTDPIYQDIGKSLQAYAQQRGITLIFDVSKTAGAMFIINEKIDITSAFIADYNQRNPASATPGGR